MIGKKQEIARRQAREARIMKYLLSIFVTVMSVAANAFPQDASPTRDLAATAFQLKGAARRSFEQGDAKHATEQLTALLSEYRRVDARDPQRWCQRLTEVAHEYLRAGEVREAMQLVGEATDLALPLQNESDHGLASAAGGLHRRLVALDADERYEMLHEWSLPTESRQSVRVLTSIVPTVAPPSIFARALGERPRRTSFAVAEIGEVRGLFCTAWELVLAADDGGSLRRLTTELDKLTEERIPNAEFVLRLAKVAAARRIADEHLVKGISEHAAKLRSSQPNPGVNSAKVNLADAALAAACLNHQPLRPVGESMLKTMIEQIQGSDAPLVLPFLRRAHAIAIQNRHADANIDVVGSPNLPLWILASRERAVLDAHGAVRAVWLSHEDHILHLSGSQNDYMLYRYPLAGEFEFSCEALDGKGRPEGGIGYGGLMFGAWGASQLFKAWDVDHRSVLQRTIPFVPHGERALFHPLALKSTADGITTFSVKGHRVWSGIARDTASPWIGLRSLSDRTPIYRNLRITGSPVIPREVRLSDDDTLRGWLACYYAESAPSVLSTDPKQPVAPPVPDLSLEWYGEDGVIRGTKGERGVSPVTQSRLSYVRPLQNSESISYEFLHEPGRYGVHPALGRLALLIEPDGVRIHWMTTGDSEWTGLPEDNAVVEPLNRRGPKPLPLAPGDWNQVTLALANDTLRLSLNDTLIYSRKLESDSQRTFSFYHDRRRTAVRVRNVVLRGDWPKTLPAEHLKNLATVSTSKRTSAARRALGAIFHDVHIADAALAVHRRAMRMPAEERYAFLSKWVLPSVDHDTLRLVHGFTPTHPAPPVQGASQIDVDRLRIAEQAGDSRVQTGSNLVAPALDLIAVAKELKRLDQLREQVADAPSNSEYEQRSRLAMLSLIDLAKGDVSAAKGNLEKLSKFLAANTDLRLATRWPETLAMWEGIRHPDTREILHDMVDDLFRQRLQKWHTSGSEAWDRHITSMIGLSQYLNTTGSSTDRFSLRPPLNSWAPVSLVTAKTRGQGFPRAHWQLSPQQVDHLTGHAQDYLYFHIPLRGDFQVECDASTMAWTHSRLLTAGTWFGPFWLRESYESGTIRGETSLGKLKPPMVNVIDWIHIRIIVRKGLMSVLFDGRKVHEEQLPDAHDPWLAIRCLGRFQGAVKNLLVSGDPTIPEELNLATSEDLTGWTSYFEESVGRPGSAWRYTDGGIIGRRQAELSGSGVESVLYYHRPMLEDGTIDYEFYYQPGSVETQPVLDRLAFVLVPDGVRIHWVTDGPHDRTALSPFNASVEVQNRRGPDSLPLIADSWNHVQLKLTEDTIDLVLNDQLVYQRKLEAGNQRTFGLFHYADQTESRVRNIVWRGNWPRRLPIVTDQPLADATAASLDRTLPKLTSVFKHDFIQDGFPPDEFVVLQRAGRQRISAEADGLHVTFPGSKGFTKVSLAAQLTLRGDFDITASFDNLKTIATHGGSSGITLAVVLDSRRPQQFDVYRGLVRHDGRPPRQLIQSQFVVYEEGGLRRDWLGVTNEEATSGRMRLARRGNTVYCLFAEADSPVFRLCGTNTVGDDDVRLGGIRLGSATHDEEGLVDVVWKQLTVHADEINPLTPQAAALLQLLANQLTGKLSPNALEFDGRTQYVTIPSIRYDGSHPITLEAFATPDGSRAIVIGDTEQSGIDLGIPGENYTMHAWNGTGYASARSNAPATPFLRIHLAGTFDGETLQLFVDGTLLKTTRLNGKFGGSGLPMTIGASPSPREIGINYAFAGVIDQVRISNNVRYTKDFKVPARFDADAATLAVYRFDEGVGQTLSDSSGNKHHGEIRGAKWVTPRAIRHRAALGLAEFGRHAVGVLTAALEHQDPGIRVEAATALGMIGKDAKPAVAALKLAAADEDQRVRKTASKAIDQIESKSD